MVREIIRIIEPIKATLKEVAEKIIQSNPKPIKKEKSKWTKSSIK